MDAPVSKEVLQRLDRRHEDLIAELDTLNRRVDEVLESLMPSAAGESGRSDGDQSSPPVEMP